MPTNNLIPPPPQATTMIDGVSTPRLEIPETSYQDAVAGLTQRLIEQANRRHWRTAKRWTTFFLIFWVLLIFIVGFAPSALTFTFFGWSFPFWVGAQGSLIAFVVIVAVYARVMNRADEHRRKTIEQYTTNP